MGLRTFDQALAWLRRHGVATLAGSSNGPPPSLVGAVVDAPVRGSWWAHPLGGTIYSLATSLEDAPDVLATKLVDGRVTFVHRALWPAVLRVVTDDAWRRRASAGLSEGARALLASVRRRGELRLDELATPAATKKALVAAKTELERRALVLSTQVHTESGKHATVLRSWEAWASEDLRAEAAKLELSEALETLNARGCVLDAPAARANGRGRAQASGVTDRLPLAASGLPRRRRPACAADRKAR